MQTDPPCCKYNDLKNLKNIEIKDGISCCLLDESLETRKLRVTTKRGSRPCKLTHLASNYDEPNYWFKNLDWEP